MSSHSMVNLLGVVAGVLTTTAFVPQVMKTWRSRRAKDLSLSMLIIFTLGVALWLAYGVVIDAFPIVAANAVTLVLGLAMLILKLRDTTAE